MNDADHAYWSDYARTLADGLGLKDWEIRIKRDVVADSVAAIHACSGRKVADIHLGKQFYLDVPDEQRSTLIHELLHLHLDGVDTAVWQVVEHIGGDALKLMRTNIRDRIEFAIDGIAAAIGHAFPLPPTREEAS